MFEHEFLALFVAIETAARQNAPVHEEDRESAGALETSGEATAV